VKSAQPACETFELVAGIVALPSGAAWMPASRTLIVADAHLGYEDVVGGALPLWSTSEIFALLTLLARRLDAQEIVFLGDIVHAAQMSEGAARVVGCGLEALRAEARLTLIAGNHEGRTRGSAILGETVDAIERDGFLLVHGDRPSPLGTPTVIGHLHPSLRLAGGHTVPAFVGTPRLVVLPAMTPYSSGLDVCSDAFAGAVGLRGVDADDADVVAACADRLFPFGRIGPLKDLLRQPTPVRRSPYRKRILRPDR